MKITIKNEKLVRVLTLFYLIPFGIMICFNTVNSLLRTTYFELYRDMETAKYRWDNPILVLAVSLMIFIFLFLIWKSKWFRETKRLPVISLCFGGAISLLIVFLVRGVAITDGATVSEITVQFMQGNYMAFERGEYLFVYPFQIGLVTCLELIYHLFGIENFIAFQILNVISIVIFLWMLSKITGELFENQSIQKVEVLLAMGMFPLFLFSTFVYGDIIGWAFGISAVYFIIRFLKTEKIFYLIGADVLFMFGIFVKSNINILLVAAVIALVLHSICKKNWKVLLWIPVLVLLPSLLMKGTEELYKNRANLDEYPKGAPNITWIAMSLQEGDEGGYAPGWYNSYNWVTYAQNDYDRKLTSQDAMENLKASLNKFTHEQRYAINYFYKKFTSQWNAPTFQSMISNEWSTRHHDNTTKIGKWMIFGSGHDLLYEMMNVYHFLLFSCVAIYVINIHKNWSFVSAYFVLNIFGGFLFHMIWEAQSRYVLGYFVMLLPLAGWGINQLFEQLEIFLLKYNRK